MPPTVKRARFAPGSGIPIPRPRTVAAEGAGVISVLLDVTWLIILFPSVHDLIFQPARKRLPAARRQLRDASSFDVDLHDLCASTATSTSRCAGADRGRIGVAYRDRDPARRNWRCSATGVSSATSVSPWISHDRQSLRSRRELTKSNRSTKHPGYWPRRRGGLILRGQGTEEGILGASVEPCRVNSWAGTALGLARRRRSQLVRFLKEGSVLAETFADIGADGNRGFDRHGGGRARGTDAGHGTSRTPCDVPRVVESVRRRSRSQRHSTATGASWILAQTTGRSPHTGKA